MPKMTSLLVVLAFATSGSVLGQQSREDTILPRSRPASPARGAAVDDGFSCGAKRVCGQMASCAEARFHLRQCGLSRLDRDGDGVPCERICR